MAAIPLHCLYTVMYSHIIHMRFQSFSVSLYIHINLYIPYSLFRQVSVRCDLAHLLNPKVVAACAPPLTFSFGCKICEETVRVT